MDRHTVTTGHRKTAVIKWLAAVVFVLSLGIRLWGLNAAGNVWDEYFYYDAMRDYVRNIIALDFNPEHWKSNLEHPPAGKYAYAPALIWNHTVQVSDRDAYHAPRFMAALYGAATVVVVFLIGVAFFGLDVGLIAALIYGLLPAVISYDKILSLDAPMVFWFTLAMYYFYRWLENRRVGTLWLATLVAGLAAISKFNALLIFPVFLTPIAIEQWPKFRKSGEVTLPLPILVFPLIVGAMLVLLFPWLWANTLDHFLAMLNHWGGHIFELFLGRDQEAPPTYFLVHFLVGTPLLVLVLQGLGVWQVARLRTVQYWTLLAWFVAPFLFSFYHLRQDHLRYIVAAFPAVALLAGIGLSVFVERWPKLKLVSWGVLAIYLLLIVRSVHPYYLNYYNELVGGAKGVAAQHLFNLGFYGDGIKEATEFVNKNAVDGATVHYEVVPDDAPYLDRPRLLRLDVVGADYLIVNSNALADPRKKAAADTTGYRLVHEVKAADAPFVWVYQRMK
jgi:4-amino-4-deoxy-L-arabinose transferase-like glycosyltransferase